MQVAILAIVWMAGTLNVMFFECPQRFKVGFIVTLLAFPMIGGVPHMLIVSGTRAEGAVTATTIGHLQWIALDLLKISSML